jgi:hypothetical protein
VLHGDLFRRLDLAIAKGRQDGIAWPAWIHAPVAASYAALSDAYTGRVSSEHTKSIDRCAAIGAWRPTKGVYRFEPALLETLWSKPIADDVLSTQLHRLPEWCVYFDLEGKSIGDIPIQGAYVHLEHQEDGYEELRVVLNCLEPKGAWARLNAVIIPLQEFVHQSLMLGPELAQAVAPIVSCALHLCGGAPKLRDEAGRRTAPTRPLVDRKRGAAPGAQRVTNWVVG